MNLLAIPPHPARAIRLRKLMAPPFASGGVLIEDSGPESFRSPRRASNVPNLPRVIPESVDAKLFW